MLLARDEVAVNFARKTRKTLQIQPSVHLAIEEWHEPRAASIEAYQAMVGDAALYFEGQELPASKVAKILARRCFTLLAVSLEDRGQARWRVFMASERPGPQFREDCCRRVQASLVLGFRGVLYAVELDSGRVQWATPLPGARFQALRVPSDKTAVIIHGGESMYRVHLSGRIEWESFGAYEFSDGLRLCQDVIEIRDVERNIYLIDYKTGDFAIRPPPLAERLKTRPVGRVEVEN